MERFLFLTDIHFPAEDKRSLDAVLNYAADSGPWDGIILNGDIGDYESVSSHNAGQLRKLENKRLWKDHEAVNKGLDLIDSAVFGKSRGVDKKKYFLEGNHEYRVERAINVNPNLEGFAEVPTALKLAERGYEWLPFWSKGTMLRVGNANFMHAFCHGRNHAKATLSMIDRPTFYGHTHDVAEESKLTLGDNKQVCAQSLGTLIDYRVDYMRGRPHRWQQAFAEFYFLPDGHFNHFVTKIFKHRFVAPNGKVYKG